MEIQEDIFTNLTLGITISFSLVILCSFYINFYTTIKFIEMIKSFNHGPIVTNCDFKFNNSNSEINDEEIEDNEEDDEEIEDNEEIEDEEMDEDIETDYVDDSNCCEAPKKIKIKNIDNCAKCSADCAKRSADCDYVCPCKKQKMCSIKGKENKDEKDFSDNEKCCEDKMFYEKENDENIKKENLDKEKSGDEAFLNFVQNIMSAFPQTDPNLDNYKNNK